MNDTDIITSARIEQTLFAGFPGASVVYVHINAEQEDEEQRLLEFYSDEIQFRADEFVGLTVAAAHQLFHDRDLAYLRS